MQELVLHSQNAGKKAERVACLPVLRALSLYSVEHGPGIDGISSLFNALITCECGCDVAWDDGSAGGVRRCATGARVSPSQCRLR